MANFIFKVPASIDYDVVVQAESLEEAKLKVKEGEWDWNGMDEIHGEWHADRAEFLYEQLPEPE